MTRAVLTLVVLIAVGIIVNSGGELFAPAGQLQNQASMPLAVLGFGAHPTAAFLCAGRSAPRSRMSFGPVGALVLPSRRAAERDAQRLPALRTAAAVRAACVKREVAGRRPPP